MSYRSFFKSHRKGAGPRSYGNYHHRKRQNMGACHEQELSSWDNKLLLCPVSYTACPYKHS
eukprot:1150781-Pelagomonas_calceolata.AAC.6